MLDQARGGRGGGEEEVFIDYLNLLHLLKYWEPRERERMYFTINR